MAHRIVTAPNQQSPPAGLNDMLNLWGKFETILAPPRIAQSLIKARVPVGSPVVELEVLIFPAQDYGCEINSGVKTNANGKDTFSMVITPETNHVAQPLAQVYPATIVMLHGYMMTKECLMPWALQLAQSGYRVVLVDLRGHGKSGGDLVTFGKTEVNDLRQVLDYLQIYGECDGVVGVFGFSYGATLGLHWAAKDSRVRTVVAIAPYNRPDETFERLARELKLPLLARAAKKAVALAAQRLQLNWNDWAGAEAMRDVRVPVLFISGEKDVICPPEDVAALGKLARGEAEILQVPRVDHFIISLWLHELTEPVERWFARKLVAPELTATEKQP